MTKLRQIATNLLQKQRCVSTRQLWICSVNTNLNNHIPQEHRNSNFWINGWTLPSGDVSSRPWCPTAVTVRGLAIKKSRKTRKTASSTEALPLMNEKLVKKIMDESVESSADNVDIRLVIEKDPKTPPESEATTLSKAITKALDLGLDLVEIDSKKEMPVVRAVKYEAKMYRTSKEKAKTQKDPSSIVKEFRFKAKIEDNDFSRKIKDVVDALKKGHKCKISTRCPRRMVGPNNPAGAGEVIERVMSGIGSLGEATKPPDINQEKTQASVLLVPKKS